MKNLLKLVAVTLVVFSLFVVLASAQETELPFTDVPKAPTECWYREALTAMYNKKIINGTSATTFEPDGTFTRAQFMTLLSNIAQIDTSAYASKVSSFADADASAWYAGPMGWAINANIVKGYDDGTIKPNASIVREEMAGAIVRYLEYMGYTLPQNTQKAQFNDYNTFKGTWSDPYIEECRLIGIFNGDQNGNFDPYSTADRAQAAQLAYNLTTMLTSYLSEQSVTIAEKGKTSEYKIFFVNNDETAHVGNLISDRIKSELGATVEPQPYVGTVIKRSKNLILMSCTADANMKFLNDSLSENEFALRVVKDGTKTKLLVGYKNEFTMSYAIEYLMTKYQKNGKLEVPANLDYRQTINYSDFITTDASIEKNVRDPYILYKDGVYYAYVTGWRMYKTTDLKSSQWDGPYDFVEVPDGYVKDKWAPEVHEYKGNYYLFTTYRNQDKDSTREYHGCAIFKSSSPEGPFTMITNGFITPQDWDAIDGTLYVDANGDPWMFFVHEHTSTSNHVGTMAVAKLSDDLTHFVTEPVELFAARDNAWMDGNITDGCFMYTTVDGELLMIWSNYDKVTWRYTIAIARCSSGNFTNPSAWTHDESLLYSKMISEYGGGHGMIFTDVDGQMYIACHNEMRKAPDSSEYDNRLMLLPITERNNTLVWDLNLD